MGGPTERNNLARKPNYKFERLERQRVSVVKDIGTVWGLN